MQEQRVKRADNARTESKKSRQCKSREEKEQAMQEKRAKRAGNARADSKKSM